MKESIIREYIDTLNGFSGVVSIKNNKHILFEESFGYADIANERKNNVNTRFGIASGAKLLTAIGIAKLVEEKKITFDDLLKNYVNFNIYSDDITIKHLLTHTSGIPDYFDEDVMSDFSELWIENPMYLLREPSDFIKLLSSGNMKNKPGECFSYNNSGFVVLALVIEKVSNMPFIEFIKKYIFDVLNMNSSGYFSMDMMPKNCANGYIKNDDGTFKRNIYSIPVIGGGDGGVFINAHDISKLWDGLLNYKILNKEITDEMLNPYAKVNKEIYYGYGIWIQKKDKEIYKYYITGSDPGVDFRSSIYVKENLEITILSNKEFGAYDITRYVEKNFLF